MPCDFQGLACFSLAGRQAFGASVRTAQDFRRCRQNPVSSRPIRASMADLGGPGSVVAARVESREAGGAVSATVRDVVRRPSNTSDVGAARLPASGSDRKGGHGGSVSTIGKWRSRSSKLAAERQSGMPYAGAVGSHGLYRQGLHADRGILVDDSYVLTTSLAKSIVAEGRDLLVLYHGRSPSAHSLEDDANERVQSRPEGGKGASVASPIL